MSKGKVILTILEAFGGLLTIAASVGSLFVKEDEPQCPLLGVHFDNTEEK